MEKRALSIVMLIAIAVAARAQVVGRLEYVDGLVEIVRNGELARSVGIGYPIENLDCVRTGDAGAATVSFDRSSGLVGSIDIGPGTTAVIRRDLVSGVTSNEVRLMAGEIGLKVSRLSGNAASFRVKTPTAVLGVRGTEFVVATFNGSSLAACGKGEVLCSPWSFASPMPGISADGVTVVPGRMAELLESGSVKTADFPKGDFESNWKDVKGRWKAFQVDLITADPVAFLDRVAGQWADSSDKALEGAETLRDNKVLKRWFAAAKAGSGIGSRADWVKERQSVMKDLIEMKGEMTVAMIHWYRVRELVPLIPESAMGKKLSNGQTVKAFVARFTRDSGDFDAALALFDAAEKQYMLRNDGLTPFGTFN